MFNKSQTIQWAFDKDHCALGIVNRTSRKCVLTRPRPRASSRQRPLCAVFIGKLGDFCPNMRVLLICPLTARRNGV
jgi:hypothetical protein